MLRFIIFTISMDDCSVYQKWATQGQATANKHDLFFYLILASQYVSLLFSIKYC